MRTLCSKRPRWQARNILPHRSYRTQRGTSPDLSLRSLCSLWLNHPGNFSTTDFTDKTWIQNRKKKSFFPSVPIRSYPWLHVFCGRLLHRVGQSMTSRRFSSQFKVFQGDSSQKKKSSSTGMEETPGIGSETRPRGPRGPSHFGCDDEGGCDGSRSGWAPPSQTNLERRPAPSHPVAVCSSDFCWPALLRIAWQTRQCAARQVYPTDSAYSAKSMTPYFSVFQAISV
jgi:hypothetical protein